MDTRQAMRWIIGFVAAALVAVFLYTQLSLRQTPAEVITLQALAKEIKEDQIAKVTIEGDTLKAKAEFLLGSGVAGLAILGRKRQRAR